MANFQLVRINIILGVLFLVLLLFQLDDVLRSIYPDNTPLFFQALAPIEASIFHQDPFSHLYLIAYLLTLIYSNKITFLLSTRALSRYSLPFASQESLRENYRKSDNLVFLKNGVLVAIIFLSVLYLLHLEHWVIAIDDTFLGLLSGYCLFNFRYSFRLYSEHNPNYFYLFPSLKIYLAFQHLVNLTGIVLFPLAILYRHQIEWGLNFSDYPFLFGLLVFLWGLAMILHRLTELLVFFQYHESKEVLRKL